MPNDKLHQLAFNSVQNAMANSFAQDEKERRAAMVMNKAFYYDKQEQGINLINEDQDAFILNLLKPIVKKKVSLLYPSPLLREWTGPAESVAFVEAVYKENKIDALLQKADLSSELTGSTLICPMADESKQSGVALRMYDASTVSVLQDVENPDKAVAVSILTVVREIINQQTMEIKETIRQQIWTDTEVAVFQGDVRESTEPNELGFIPFVNFKAEEVYDQYLGHSPATGIRKLNASFNKLLTDLAFTIKFQSFTPLAVTGMQGDSLVTLHPGSALNLPAGATATVLDTRPKIDSILSVMQYLEEKAYETCSVPKVSVVGGGDATSGRELVIRWFPLLNYFTSKATQWEEYELELANLILRFVGLPAMEDVKINWIKENILPVTEEEDTLVTDIQLNIKTAADEIQRRNPQVSEIEAEAIALANKDFNATMNPSGQAPTGANTAQGVKVISKRPPTNDSSGTVQ